MKSAPRSGTQNSHPLRLRPIAPGSTHSKRFSSGSGSASGLLSTHSSQLSSRLGSRFGFTLIELMIVIVIIAILIALLVPAAGNAIRRARVAGVKAEISQLESAIAKFKADHGVEPPSSIILHENVADWQTDPTNTATIRQIWPQYNFATKQDFNFNNTVGETGNAGAVALTGSECLVFFLGGIRNKSTTGFSMTGFSKDPSNPFGNVTVSTTREAPLFEFNTARLSDIDNDNYPEYKDSLPSQKNPYLYYSSYDGQGYNAAEFYGNTNTFPGVTYGLYLPYQQGVNTVQNTVTIIAPAWKPNSYQIISPGYDGTRQLLTGYGYGGAYVPSGTPTLPLDSTVTTSGYAKLRVFEADNITNFAQAELQP